MAIEYVAASSQYHRVQTLAGRLSGRDVFSISAWARTDLTDGGVLVALNSPSGAARHQMEYFFGTLQARMVTVDSAGSFSTATTTATASTGVWNHMFGRVRGASLRTIMLNGGSLTTDTTSITSVSHTTGIINGRLSSGVPGFFHDGAIAHVAIWNDYLSSADGVALWRGVSPLRIRPDALVYYFPMAEGRGDLRDIVSGAQAAAVNAPAFALYRGPTIYGAPNRRSRTFARSSTTGIAGPLAATEPGADTFAASGQVVVQGTLAATESGADTFASAGDVVVQGALAVTESATDAFAATGTSTGAVAGVVAAAEVGSDSFTAPGVVLVQGGLVALETGSDTFAATSSAPSVVVGFSIVADGGIRIAALDGITIL